jgi:hypothetical protein
MISLPNRKALPALVALVLLILTVAACKNFFVDPKLTSIAVNNVNVVVGQTAQAVATGTFDDGSTQTPPAHVVWSLPSGDTTASVSSTGAVMGLSAGSAGSATTTVTATVGAISGTGTVTVSCGTILSIAISPSSQTIAQGGAFPFKATATYASGSGCAPGDVTSLATWTSSDTTLFTVESTGSTSPGMVTAGNTTKGTGTLTASLGGQSGTAAITIN